MDSDHDRLPGFMRDVLSKSLTIRGFINYDFGELYPDFLRDMGPSIKAGEIKYKEDIVDGLDNAPKAFMGMLEGRNFGNCSFGCVASAHQSNRRIEGEENRDP